MSNTPREPMAFIVRSGNKGNYRVAVQGPTRWTTCSGPMCRAAAESYARSISEVLGIELEFPS